MEKGKVTLQQTALKKIWVFDVMLMMYFIVGVFTVINQQFQIPLRSSMLPKEGNITNALVTLLNFSWFLAYPFSEKFATRWLELYGYRRTMLLALIILISGLEIYELAVLQHLYIPVKLIIIETEIPLGFFTFLIGSFVIGISAAVLQVVLNLYLSVSSVGNTTALQRQMIGGSVNSIGMAIAPLMVSHFIFYNVSLSDVNSSQFLFPVFIIILIMILVTVLVSRIKFPDLPENTNTQTISLQKSIWSFRRVRLGLWALGIYVGVEVAVGANINMYAVSLGHSFALKATHMAALYWGFLLIGRLVGSFLKDVSSQRQLLVCTVGAIFFLLLAIIFDNPWILTLIGLFHSIMWPAIFTLATDRLGPYTAKASGILMIGVIGGGIIPLLQGIGADVLSGIWRWTWGLIILGEAYILFYALSGYKIKSELPED